MRTGALRAGRGGRRERGRRRPSRCQLAGKEVFPGPLCGGIALHDARATWQEQVRVGAGASGLLRAIVGPCALGVLRQCLAWEVPSLGAYTYMAGAALYSLVRNTPAWAQGAPSWGRALWEG